MAQYEEFTLDQGADVAIELHCVDKNGATKDLNNHLVTAKLKKNYNSSDSDTTEFTSIIGDADDGIVTISLTNTQTDALRPGRYVYDVELSFVDDNANTIIERILEGRIQISPSVTK